MKMNIYLAACLLLLFTRPVHSVTLLSFGGSNMNDMTAVGMSDDSSFEITTTTPLTFYGAAYSSLWLGSNGYIALQDTVAYANAIPTPLNLKLIAPLFDDIRPSSTGNIYYRQTSDAADITESSTLVTGLLPDESPYTATYVLVVTWSNYQIFGQPGRLTFQTVVTTDGTRTFAVFLYQQLTTGLDADIGIDAGDGTNYYKLCIGGGPVIQSLPDLKQSCNSDPGVFGFRIDTVNPDQGSYSCTASFQDINCAGCPDLTNPDNGAVDTSAGTLVGDIASYSCLGGFDLIGDSTRECLSDNNWSGAEPTCEVTPVCPVLINPENGSVDTSAGKHVGDIATYSCLGGFDLIGDSARECLPDTTWSGAEPTCQIIPDCPGLTAPDHGIIDVPVDRQVGDIATYTCLGGYDLIGDSTRECLPDNSWSGSETTCQITPDCPALTAPDDGTIDVPLDRQVSDIATYTCLGGYDLMGDPTRECLPDNTWSGSEPTCQITPDCPALTAPDDGLVDVPADRQVGDIATYTCSGGFDLAGDSTRECLLDNTWSGSEPTSDCPALTTPNDGSVAVSTDRQVGDIATYTCLGGYDLIGDSTRECLPDNTWSGSDPTCQLTPDCAALTAPAHGSVEVSASRQVGDIAVYICIGGYDLVGNSTRQCLSDNTWSGSQPICQVVASYYCAWNDVGHTLVDVVFVINLPGAREIMAVDTQKYEDGQNPTLSDSSCRTVYTTDPTTLTFTVDPYITYPGCGVRSSGSPDVTLDVTIRVYYDDIRFDMVGDRIYKFSCSTDTILPKVQTQSKEFNGIEVTSVPSATRSLQLLVISSGTDDIVTAAIMGQLIQLRIIYDNTASNVEPYGIYVSECTVANTINFDASTVALIQNGCVLEQNPGGAGFMSRSFRQTSLSPAGLFITDSGKLAAFRFLNSNKLFFRCVVDFCFFLSTAPNLCTDSCATPGRRKRRESTENQQIVYTSVTVLGPIEAGAQKIHRNTCISSMVVYTTLGSFGFLILASLTLSFVLFSKLIRIRTRRIRRRTRH